jgi:hypothetical protein
MDKPIKCSNCNKITKRISVLPLCKDCLAGLEDFESKYSDSLKNVQIEINNDIPKIPADDFFKI